MILSAIAMANGLLTQPQIGNFEMLVFVGFALSFFWVDGIVKSYLIEYEETRDRKRLTFHVYALLSICALCVLILLWAGSQHLIPGMLGQPRLDYMKWYAIYLCILLPTNMISVHFMLRNQIKWIYFFGALMLIGPALCVVLTVGLGTELETMYQAFVGYASVLHITTLFFLYPTMQINFDQKVIRKILVLAWPLMLYVIAVSMARIFDSWLVSWYFQDDSIFAIFRYGAREFPLAVALSAGLTTAFIPMIQKDQSAGLLQLKERSRRLMHFIFPVSMVAMLASPFIFRLVFTEQFVPSAEIFNIYLLLILSQILFPHALLLAFKKNQLILRVALIELSINVILSIILVRHFDLQGVATATVIAYFAEKLIFFYFLKRKFKISSHEFTPWRWYLIYAIGLLSCYFLTQWLMF